MNKHPSLRCNGVLTLSLFLSLAGARLIAGSATWNLNPVSGIWNDPTNWTPTTVPNGAADTATFGASNTANTEVNGIVFNSPGYTINVSGPPATAPTLVVSGTGITNAGTFLMGGGRLRFSGSATAGPATLIIPAGDPVINPGELRFLNTATAGSSVITIAGSTANGGFADAFFANNSSGGSSTITTGGSSGRVNDLGGMVNFLDNATAANATLIVNGGTTPGALGGFQFFSGSGSAGAATLIANGGTGGGDGGRTFFTDQSSGGTARDHERGRHFRCQRAHDCNEHRLH